mmetsp:Transcript_30232/g.93280  ORF Transcript_30232/g.93280 Transcript_30232/m.93280 type:complete len:115 (+) Transcript_30232:405-749(+)
MRKPASAINRASWVTARTPPLKFLTASMRASTDSTSRWFVGSSNKRKCGFSTEIDARATRAFWPPESAAIIVVCPWPSSPKEPRILRASNSSLIPFDTKYATGVCSSGSLSTKC